MSDAVDSVWRDGCGISQENWFPLWQYFESPQFDAPKPGVKASRKKRMWQTSSASSALVNGIWSAAMGISKNTPLRATLRMSNALDTIFDSPLESPT